MKPMTLRVLVCAVANSHWYSKSKVLPKPHGPWGDADLRVL